MTFRYITILTAFVAILAQGFKVFSKGAFIENIGQVTDQYLKQRSDIIAKYQAGNGLNIFFSETGIHYQWSKDAELYRMDVKLSGGNPNPRISKDQRTGFREQYQLAGVKGTAYSYNRITYHDIYPGIDWTFYFNAKGQLEHDFIVKPGAKVSDIRLQYLGADKIRVDKYGNLIATTAFGSITEPKPYSYEKNSRRKISSNYILNGTTVSFKTGSYSGTLVIDPIIEWATYMGGSEYDDIKDVKIGIDSFVYVIGSTNSTSNLATVGSHLTSFQGGTNSSGSDAFLSKFDSDGNCIWSTYYGGSNVDVGLSLAIDTAGYLYMAGRTNSQTGISTQGSQQPIKAGNASGYDAFIVKFDTSGTPVWGTYFGGNFSEGTNALALSADRYNNLYIAGNTNSSSGIATPSAYLQTRPGGEEGFIAKFNTAGNLQWATYLGTSMNDHINAVTTDTTGNVIVAGHTQGTTGLATTGTHLQTGNGGTDAFVAKFDSAGQRIWGTYYGGSENDILYTLITDSFNNIYFGGVTNSTTGIASLNSHQNTLGGMADGCLGKFNPDGSLEWSTYFGGTENDGIFGLCFANSKLFITGWTNSPNNNNMVTQDAIVPVYNNSASEGLLVSFSPTGTRLYGTYFGGDATEEPKALAIKNDLIFIGGKTSSVNNFATSGSHQNSFNGNQDGMLLKINLCDLPTTPLAIDGNTSVCENSQQQYTIPAVSEADSYVWLMPNGWVGTSTTDTLNAIAGSNSGDIRIVALNSCGASDTISLPVSVNPAPQATISRNGNILSVSQTFSNYQWLLNGNPIPGATNPTTIIAQNGSYSLQVTGSNGCVGISNEIIVTDQVAINELDKIGIKIYPNPFREKLTITVPFDVKLVVYDLAGKILYQFEVPKGNEDIDLSKLNSANYILRAYRVDNGQVLGIKTLVKLSK